MSRACQKSSIYACTVQTVQLHFCSYLPYLVSTPSHASQDLPSPRRLRRPDLTPIAVDPTVKFCEDDKGNIELRYPEDGAGKVQPSPEVHQEG